jgi:hypothetical protein
MNRFRLRIFGLMVLILAVVIGVYSFRPSRPSNSQDSGQIPLHPDPGAGEPTADADLTANRPISLQTSRSEDPRAA